MGKAISSVGVALLVKCWVKKTTDVSRDANKIYYELDSTNNVYVVASESTAVASLYEICASNATGAVNQYTQITCLTDVPDIGGESDKIETTTLCDRQRTYIEGVLDAGESLDFSANYVHNVFVAIKTILLGNLYPCKIVFGGMAGGQGAFSLDGYIDARIGGFGVSEVIPMTISLTIASAITYA